MFGALVKFAREAEYSWHTPGHTGGTAFLRSPAGRMFYDYFGENLLRSDLSISVGELGSLLDHSGPIGEGERYAAHVFGADRTYYVTNGTSTSNRVVMMANVARGQIVLADRNCHKSIEHGLSMTGAAPVYLMPYRNHLGLIGPIPPAALTREAVARRIADSPLAKGIAEKPALAIVTNSTYDGLCYNATRVEELLDASVDRILFDEAWFAYARFNPLYANRHAMRGDLAQAVRTGPTIFATQSTHKLLAALSQASMIHLREGRVKVEHERFNESFMMHASTSPQYAIIASADVSAAMMDGAGGPLLTGEAIAEAISFRQTMARLHAAKGDWFFSAWQPDTVQDGGAALGFADAPAALLAGEQKCWLLEPGAAWHGFPGLEPGYAMLDPIKVTVVTPGLDDSGTLASQGIPAPLLSAYLGEHGIVVEKTANFSVLFLFSIGVTKGKWGSLVNALLDFKRDYDANTRLARAMPVLAVDVFAEKITGSANKLMAKPFGLMLEALDDLAPGEIYVNTGSSPRNALWGELMSTRALKLGAAGAIVNGYSRDTNGIFKLNFPTFSLGRYAQDSAPRYKVVDFRIPIEIGGVRINPGDLLYGDIDGVCVIPRAVETEVFTKALEKARGEKRVRKAIEGGMSAVQAFKKFGIM